jgi:hypothetical protein
VECPYAFDYVERDWKSILFEQGFDANKEKMWFKNYLRLLTVKKSSCNKMIRICKEITWLILVRNVLQFGNGKAMLFLYRP